MLSTILPRWFVTLPLIALTVALAAAGYLRTPPVYESTGTVLVARPQVDPSRADAASVDARELVQASQTERFREDVTEAGGIEDFEVFAVDDVRLQVLATGDGAVTTVGRVLQRLADELASRQAQQGVSPEERIRARLIIQAPEADAVGGPGFGEATTLGGQREVVGLFLLQDFTLGVDNPFGNPAAASRLLLIEVRSDDGRARFQERLGEAVTFSVNQLDRRARDLLWITIAGPDPGRTLDGFDEVVDLLDAELDRRQEFAGIPPAGRLIIDVIAAPLETVEHRPGAQRTALVILAGGGLVTFAAAVLPVPGRPRRPAPG